MTAKIIAVAQQKGGAGKTSVAAHLATALGQSGKTVGLIDVDPQQSLSAWHDHRVERYGDEYALDFATVEGWKAPAQITQMKRKNDFIVIDTPPHAETAARQAVREADLVLIPLQLSPMDVWAMRATLDLVDRARTGFLLVLNRVPPRSNLADDLRAELKKEKLPVAKTTLGNRTAFASSLMEGRGITEASPRSRAGQEMAALAKEVAKKA
ncbi:MAG: ParA family partition ATPase [Alphaproteobacteria bacterium]